MTGASLTIDHKGDSDNSNSFQYYSDIGHSNIANDIYIVLLGKDSDI